MRITAFPILSQIKNKYSLLRQEGASRNEAVTRLKNNYRQEIECGAQDDRLLFWIGIADAQYAHKELSEDIAQLGFAALDQLEQADWQIAHNDLFRRREWYAKAPMPERKYIDRPKRFRCAWKIGDTYAYMLLGDDAEQFGLSGRYVLFRKVGEAEESNGIVEPIVTVSMWDDAPLPTTSAEFKRMPILKLDNGRANTRKDQYIYRTEMLIENEKALEKLSLSYLGNFVDVEMPKDEAVIQYVGFMKKLALNQIEKTCCYYWRNHHIYEGMT